MRVLVTGAAGFIGRYLVPALEHKFYEVFAYDRTQLDVLNVPLMRRVVLNTEPDCIVHLAAATGRDIAVDPYDVAQVNVGATGALARMCGEWGIRFVYASSSEVHNVCNLYGLTKLQGEEIANLYCDPLTLRFVMPYGPGFRGTSMYPGPAKNALVNFLWAALHDKSIRVHAGSARSWVWIDDLVAGVVRLIEAEARGVYDVGRDDDMRPMRWVAEHAYELVGKSARIEEVEPPSNVTPIKRISTAALQATGWKPKVELEDGMERTLHWLRTIA